MRVKIYLVILITLLCISSGCSKNIVTPKLIKNNINIVPHPIPVKLINVKFFIVNDDNFIKFKKDIIKKSTDFVFCGISIKNYENLSLNIQDLKRFIIQQKEIILYYEEALTKE